ncbi:hypothetical protein L1987_80356 [Smallanthus sonchifolius]|uniref:Uncharacterized protein n=1 Tax=Smallanthus sonchifolius TaxID=185202 RepID=A0ACB8YNI4_9ASTR|nr:hypothetical protein L1987_80356 [Smallanthus sonchifolius]
MEDLFFTVARERGASSANHKGYRLRLTSWNVGSLTIAKELHGNVVEVKRYNDRIMVLRVVLGEEVVAIVSAYAPHVGLGDQERRDFWGSLDGVMRSLPRQDKICLGGDFNGHVGKESDCFSMVHGGFGHGVRNDNGRELLDFALAHDLGIINTQQRKPSESHWEQQEDIRSLGGGMRRCGAR